MGTLRTGLLTAVTLLVVAAATPAQAWSWGDKGAKSKGRGDRGRPSQIHTTPEFDPATAGVIASLLAGGGVLLARRRR